MYNGGDESVGIFLHRSKDDTVVKGEENCRCWQVDIP